MFVVKNLEELASGNIKCKLLAGGVWGEFIMSPLAEYELHESSDWEEIKPCPQDAKDTYKVEQENAAVISDLNTMDTSIRQLEEALAGDTEALALIAARVATKKELRGKLK